MATIYNNASIIKSGLVLHLDTMNVKSYSGSGTTWKDMSGNGYDASMYNGLTYENQYFKFDGINDYVTVPNNITYSGGFTISLWMYSTAFDSTLRRIVDKTNGTTGSVNGFFLYANTSSNVSFNINAGTVMTTDANTIMPYTWNHIVVSVNSSGVTNLYVNGVLIKTQTVAAPSGITTTNLLTIGNRSTSTDRPFAGAISSVKIYQRDISSTEVSEDYNATKWRYANFTGTIVTTTPQFVSSTSSGTNTLVAMPTYQAGDLLLLCGVRTGGSTESTTPSGYTRITGGNSTGGVGAAGTLWYKIATGSETVPTLSSGFITAMLVYRGVSGIGASAINSITSTTTNFVYPTLTLSGSSFVVGFAVNPTYNFSTPASMTMLQQFEDVPSPTTGSHAIAITPTAGRVTTWSGVTSTISSGRIGITMSVEITA